MKGIEVPSDAELIAFGMWVDEQYVMILMDEYLKLPKEHPIKIWIEKHTHSDSD